VARCRAIGADRVRGSDNGGGTLLLQQFGPVGVCSVTLASLDGGPYRFKIENDSFWPGAEAVQVTAQVSVEKGRIQVWLEDPAGNKIAQNVKPGESVELKGAADMTSFSSVSILNHRGTLKALRMSRLRSTMICRKPVVS
jgi:hypothetical protein